MNTKTAPAHRPVSSAVRKLLAAATGPKSDSAAAMKLAMRGMSARSWAESRATVTADNEIVLRDTRTGAGYAYRVLANGKFSYLGAR